MCVCVGVCVCVCVLQMHLSHVAQVVEDLLFGPVHNQHTPLLLVELAAVAAVTVVAEVSVVSPGVAAVICNSTTMEAAAAVCGRCLCKISGDTMDFPNSSKNNLHLYVFPWFQEGSIAVYSMNAFAVEEDHVSSPHGM